MRTLVAPSTFARLSRAMLPTLAGGPVSVPQYDPSQITEGILHVGVGNFHRAHFAAYMDDLFHVDLENHSDWGIVGAGIMSFDAKKREVLQQQDWMQTLVAKDGASMSARLIAPMVDYLDVDFDGKQHTLLRQKLASPSIKIVTLTVTEGGYYLNDGKFDPNHPDIMRDIKDPSNPQTIFGMIVQALKIRRDDGTPPFTVMSCDNIPHNGKIVRSVVVGLAREIDADLADWIEEHGAFPNSMVDRITPATTQAQMDLVQKEFGYQDDAPIFCEPFRQWVIEDNFCQGRRPKWEQLDRVTFVPDVAPYENMKLRILNGGHASLCYPAALLGVETVDAAMEHPTIGAFLDALERTEIIPNVPPVPNTDLTEYWEIVSQRFANPTLQDTIGRNCFDGANRQPKFIVPIAADALEAGTKCDGLALVSALWCRYCQGKTEAGNDIAPNDPQWDKLQALALKAKTDPVCWLGMSDVYGKVGQNKVFQEAFTKALNNIEKHGVEATMAGYIRASKPMGIPQ